VIRIFLSLGFQRLKFDAGDLMTAELDFDPRLEQRVFEDLLREAGGKRKLMALLMENDWLGLRLMAWVRVLSQPNISELASSVTADVNCVAAAARLVGLGALVVKNCGFRCTEEGLSVLARLEETSGMELDPRK
jgi:hypothetical protein